MAVGTTNERFLKGKEKRKTVKSAQRAYQQASSLAGPVIEQRQLCTEAQWWWHH